MSVPSFSGLVASSLEGQGHDLKFFNCLFNEIIGKVINQMSIMVMLVTIMAVMM